MIIQSIYFDTLGHVTYEKNQSDYFHKENSEYHSISFSEILNKQVWLRKLISLIAIYPKNWALGRFRSELGYSLATSIFLMKTKINGILHIRTQSLALLPWLLPSNYIISLDMTTKEYARNGHNLIALLPLVYLEKQSFKKAKAIIAISKYCANSIINDYGISSEKVFAIYAPVSPLLFEIGKARNYSTELIRILFIGNDFARKGGHEVLSAFIKLRKLHPKLELTLVSNDPFLDNYKEKNITIFKNLPANSIELLVLFQRADLLLVPTKEEAYGLVFSEAAACGLPCIGTNIAAIPEMVEHCKTGLLLDKCEESAIIKSLTFYIDNPEKLDEFGKAAYKLAVEKFYFETQMKKISNVFSLDFNKINE